MILSFLEEVDATEVAIQFEEPTTVPSINDIKNFTLGFVEGSAFFFNLTHQAECLDRASSPAIYTDIQEIVALFKNISIHSDFIGTLRKISEDAVDVYTKVVEAYTSCESWQGESAATLAALAAHIKSDGYFTKVSQHSMMNMGPISDRFTKAAAAFTQANYGSAGFASGDLVNFALFWDFTRNTTLF
jgi:hypothetical protein